MSSLSLDAEYATSLHEILPPNMSGIVLSNAVNMTQRRTTIESYWSVLILQLPACPDVQKVFLGTIRSYDGCDISIYKFCKRGANTQTAGPAVVYIHGGGFISLSVEHYTPLLAYYVWLTGVPIFAMDYRLAPEHPYPVPLEDCYACLKYVSDNGSYLGVHRDRIAVMGDGMGGALAAGVAIFARHRGLPLAKQLIIDGSLDDRNVFEAPHELLEGLISWHVADNEVCWHAYLGDNHEFQPNISPAAAPSRLKDASGLAPLYMDVPGLDINREECVEYAMKLANAGIDVEVHVYPGVPHSFETYAPSIRLARMAFENRARALTGF